MFFCSFWWKSIEQESPTTWKRRRKTTRAVFFDFLSIACPARGRVGYLVLFLAGGGSRERWITMSWPGQEGSTPVLVLVLAKRRGYPCPGLGQVERYLCPEIWLGTPSLLPPARTRAWEPLSIPQKRSGTRHQRYSHPQERTWDQRLGSVWTDTHLWKQYLPHQCVVVQIILKNHIPNKFGFSQNISQEILLFYSLWRASCNTQLPQNRNSFHFLQWLFF